MPIYANGVPVESPSSPPEPPVTVVTVNIGVGTGQRTVLVVVSTGDGAPISDASVEIAAVTSVTLVDLVVEEVDGALVGWVPGISGDNPLVTIRGRTNADGRLTVRMVLPDIVLIGDVVATVGQATGIAPGG